MFEEFYVVDLKKFEGKEKTSYYLLICSSLEYCFRAYMSKEQYDILYPHKQELFSNFDVNKNIQKVYNAEKKSFTYFVRLAN